ncbi:hypothetical protein [Lacisediminihabitans sp.]|uniref:hypothetical protein n=1 Tax=Lacisediminihabitans sp. TaxID=2787631 RepID=UPI00374CDEEA
MYLRDLVRSLGRRWYFVLLGLALTAGLCVAALRVVPVSYNSEASIVLLPPKTSTEPNGNPFLYLGGLSQAVDVLTRTISSDETAKPLLKANPGAKFTIAADVTTTGPIILITSNAPTAAGAQAMTSSVLEAVPTALDSIQSELAVKPQSKISVMTIAVDAKGKLDAKTRTQAVIGIGAVGIVLTILLTGLVDGLMRSRRRRNTPPSDDSGDSLLDSAASDPDADENRAEHPTVVHARSTRESGPPAPAEQASSPKSRRVRSRSSSSGRD